MKRILLAAGLGLGIFSVVTAGATANHATAPNSGVITNDTVPKDTTSPAPKDTTTRIYSPGIQQ